METTVQQTKPPLVLEKRMNWADLGEAVHYLELKLQAQAQASLAKIKIPSKISEIAEAEATLKEIKKEKTQTETYRKTATSRLDSITTRLMLPEKSFELPVKNLESAIITIKKADEEKRKEVDKKNAQIKECREYLVNHKNAAISSFNTKIINKVDAAYTYSLGDGNITVEGLPKFLETASGAFKIGDFTIIAPANSFSLINKDEYTDLLNELLANDPNPFILDYQTKLRHKFSDFEIAINNKVQALELARKEKEDQEKRLAEEKLNAEIAAKLSAIAITPVVNESPVKDLKSAWKIDMEENLENSVLVITAFVSNISIIKPMLKVNKFDSFSVGQMKTYLCKCKTQDSNFNFTGLIFKSIDKL